MTKNELRKYARRRDKILKLAKTLRQADIARLLGMTPQRVQQIVKAGNGS